MARRQELANHNRGGLRPLRGRGRKMKPEEILREVEALRAKLGPLGIAVFIRPGPREGGRKLMQQIDKIIERKQKK